tara:strand:- start:291 stop:533 length:243 start_codon:yes stop_codon:yes gene_type:complete
MSIVKFGETDLEKTTKDSRVAREIVSEILNFGVTQQQILRVAYLLSLELENKDAMINISNCVKEYLENLGEPSKKSIIET